jgi:hypothetical protein
LDTSYQDFLNQQNYPYKQLGFMSDLLRGTPTGSSSVTQMYQAPPSALQTVGALGMGAYGINQLSKYGASGGLMDSYADGGQVYGYAGDQGSVTSEDNIAEIISTLSPQQLQQAKQNALARRDMPTVEAIDQRLAELASEKSISQGIAGAMPQQMADGVVNAAGGGILAFADGGIKHFDGEEGSLVQIPQYAGDPALYKKFGERAMTSIDEYSNLQAPRAYTPQEEEALDERSMARAKKLIGPSPIPGIKTELEGLKAESKKALQQGRGLAALAAMEGMLEPGGALRGAGKAAKNFVAAYAPAVSADQDVRKSTTLMNINLANAQRAESMGLGKEAMAYTNQAIAARREAGKAERELLQKKAELDLRGATAFRPPSRGSGAGSGPKPKFDEDTGAMINQIIDLKRNPKADPNLIADLEAKVKARTDYKQSIRDVGPGKADLEGNKLDLATADKAADAWGNMSMASKKSFAAANGFNVSRDPKTNKFVDPEWEEKSRQVHAKGFKPAGGASAPKVIKIPD